MRMLVMTYSFGQARFTDEAARGAGLTRPAILTVR
jgi:hypothetical protein